MTKNKEKHNRSPLTYHPCFHRCLFMCSNWIVIAHCLLQLLHLLMKCAHLGSMPFHPDKTLLASLKQNDFLLTYLLTYSDWDSRALLSANNGEHNGHCNCNTWCLHFRRVWVAWVLSSLTTRGADQASICDELRERKCWVFKLTSTVAHLCSTYLSTGVGLHHSLADARNGYGKVLRNGNVLYFCL